MKIGDLVRRKFSTNASMRRFRHQLETDPMEIGMVIEVAENACKVIFPNAAGNIRSFLKSSLESIDE